MLSYKEYEKTVFDWFMSKHQKNPSFTFSVRQKGSKGSELDYFIGTEKSKYFGTTFWSIPTRYPGSSMDLIDLFFNYSESNKYSYHIEFTQTNSPYDEQNQLALDLIRNLKPKIKKTFGLYNDKSGERKMESFTIYNERAEFTNLTELFKQLEVDLKILIPIVDEAISEIKKSNKIFNADRISEQDFDDMISKLYQRQKKYSGLSSAHQANESDSDYHKKKYWLLASGIDSDNWDEFYNHGFAAIFWNEVGNLKQYGTKEEIRANLIKVYPELNTSQTNNALCLWQFSNVMKEGDIVVVKQGVENYLGYGVVAGEYEYNEISASAFHTRKIEWKKKGVWKESVHQIVTKTLTDITKYPEYVDRLKRLIGIEQSATINPDAINYYWLNANPKYWRITDFEVGEEQSYTTYNEKGNKRNRFEHFQNIKPGDLIIGYESTPNKKVVAIFETTKSAHKDDDDDLEKISFRIQKFLPTPITYETIKEMPELKDSEVMKNNQGSLFKLTKAEFESITNKDLALETEYDDYTYDDATTEIFLPEAEIRNILDTLAHKKNIILQGPPGVGKTYMAKRLAYLRLERKDTSKVEMLQFHQSYSYEDFIQGYRPKESGSFKLENGVFYRFCKRAQSDPENDYFFIIDEINRGNLSKIFGELMLLIESDKRGLEYAIPLTYSPDIKFHIPSNVYMIGTMNTADRSLAVVDYALRRRFSFIEIPPMFNNNFVTEMENRNVDKNVIKAIQERIGHLNSEIEKDQNLKRGFKIGHSYFCNIPENGGNTHWYNGIIKNEIAPLLKEYWFDEEDKATDMINKLTI